MHSSPNSQDQHQLHNSTTVWSQPETDEQRLYYSKHAAEKRVFGWITTLLQTAHGAIAFAAWTAIYLWVFKNIPFMLPTAPFLAGGTLIALHILFRTTWQTYWYDRLDDDPNTDSPIWVPLAIIVLLLLAEVQGARQYLAGQVAPIERKNTDDIDGAFRTEVASIEQAYRNDVAAIDDIYKTRLSPIERQINNLRYRSADTDEERRSNRARIAALNSQRDNILGQKAADVKKALDAATDQRAKATARRDALTSQVDNHNAGELARYTADMGSVSTYAWVLSVGLLLLISGLSYRTVRINVKSGILPLRNYTVLDAHGSIAERLFTAFGDAINRQSLQFAVWIHRLLSPKKAITSFDGTVVAKPGTYNTPEGFWTKTQHEQADTTSPLSTGEGSGVILKTEEQAAREVLEKMAANPHIRLTPQQVQQEIAISMRSNGHYPTMPLDGGKKPEAPAGPLAPPAGATRTAPEYTPLSSGEGSGVRPLPTYAQMLEFWRKMVQNQLDRYDQAVRDGQPTLAAEIQRHVMTDPESTIVKEGRRLKIEWGVRDGEFVVRHRDRQHFVPLEKVTEPALLGENAAEASAPVEGEDDNLFKYDLNKFKAEVLPERDPITGKVIGVKYRKTDGGWGNVGYAQVLAFRKIYEKYNQKESPGERVREGLAKWNYALSLFDQDRAIQEEEIQPVTI